MRRFVNKYLAKFISKKTLLRLEKPNYSTHLQSLTLNKLVKIKLSLYFVLRFFKQLVAFGLLTPLDKAFKETHCVELLVYAEVLYQRRDQIFSFWVIFRSQILLSKFFLSFFKFIFCTWISVLRLRGHKPEQILSQSWLKGISVEWSYQSKANHFQCFHETATVA